MAHGNARQSFPLFIVEPLRDGLGNPLVDFPGETRGPAAEQERPSGRERREGSRHREMPDRLTAGQHAERPRQGGDKHPECRYRGPDGKQADAETPETRPRRPVRGVTPGSRRARVGLRTTHFEPGTPLPGHDADEIAPSPDPCGGQIRHPVRSPQSRGTAFSNQECRALTFEDAVGGFASQKFAGVPVAGIDGGLDRSGNFGVADGAVRDVATVQLA